MDVPLPPAELAVRVGVVDGEHPLKSFDEMGAGIRETLVALQPPGWFTVGRRVLDFGCGAGKLLRHVLPEAEAGCEFLGCDIDEPSIAWLQEHLSPPLKVFRCAEEPGLTLPDEHVDLVWAMSVFTHITDHWAGWLLELHRVLRPGGRLVSTFLGRGMSESIAGEPWDPDRIGMNVLHMWQPWNHGGPSVQHSEWWLRAHWGRAFDIEDVRDRDDFGHGLIVVRKRDVDVSIEQLEALEPDEREIVALRHNIRQLHTEVGLIADDRAAIGAHLDALVHELEALRAERDSKSPSLMASVRAAAARLRS